MKRKANEIAGPRWGRPMRNLGTRAMLFGLVLALVAGVAAAAPAVPAEGVPSEGLVGEWLGALDLGAVKLRLVVRVEEQEGGGLAATFESVDQGATIPIDRITAKDKAVSFAIDQIGGAYEGTFNEDRSAIEGTWSQSGQTFPLTLRRTAEPFELKRPQNPEPPFPYTSRDVIFHNEASDIDLAGTVLVPEGKGPFPAVVFVTGSGAQDRDESLMGHRPFLVIADALARHGIASLRYDDRGAGESEGDHFGSTEADFTTDALAGIAFLAAQPEIDPKALGILGHSEGGLIGPRAAILDDRIDFLVLLAPPGEPLDQLLMRQGADMLRLNGVDAALIEKSQAAQAKDLALVKDASLSTEDLAEKLRAQVEQRLETWTAEEKKQLGINDASVEQSLQLATSPWFRSLLRQDPATYLGKIKIPVLALFGGKDVQVSPEVNAKLVETSLKAAGNQDVTVRILPGLNHLFQHADTGAVAEYGTIEETISPEVLEIIGSWIGERFDHGKRAAPKAE